MEPGSPEHDPSAKTCNSVAINQQIVAALAAHVGHMPADFLMTHQVLTQMGPRGRHLLLLATNAVLSTGKCLLCSTAVGLLLLPGCLSIKLTSFNQDYHYCTYTSLVGCMHT